jgi:hypothetical protein
METIAPSYTHVSNFVTPQQYADLCGVNLASVFRRFRNGQVAGVRISGKVFIDVETSPPAQPYTVKFSKAPAPRLPEGLPPLSKLVCLDAWTYKKNVTANRYYAAIFFGQLPAWGFGDQVVVELSPALLSL